MFFVMNKQIFRNFDIFIKKLENIKNNKMDK